MKKWLVWLLALLCAASFALAEDMTEKSNAAVPGEAAALEEVIAQLADAPYSPEGMEKAVFGKDDRTTIHQPGVYPYSAIAYLNVKGKCGCGWTGSGFMVGKSSMATAAHCLICHEHNAWAAEITMFFGYRSNKNYTYCYTGGTTYWCGSNPFATGSYISEDDYAYLKLEQPVGDHVGWFGVRHADASQHGQTFTVAGYRNGVLKSSSGRVDVCSDKLLSYQTDTEPGYSGCPVFDSEYYAVAINVSHDNSNNYARRFTANVVTDMHRNGMFD